MRVALAIAVGLACPSLAAAQAAGDRYGPPSAARLTAVAGEAYRGPTLAWTNKAAAESTAQSALPPAPIAYREVRVYAPFQPQVPLPLQQVRQPAPAAVEPPAYRPVASAPVQPPLQAQAPQRMAAVAPAAGGHTRFYSVHRGYGLTPDAIPEPPAGDRYVLIGPPDAPAPKTDEQDGEPLGSRPDSF